eukprot:scaffold1782_cov123-Isochrysis_galbana.AAC.13
MGALEASVERGRAETAATAEEARRETAASARAADLLRESLSEARAGRALAAAELEAARAEIEAVREQRGAVQTQLAVAEERLALAGKRLDLADEQMAAAARAATEAEHRLREAEAERDRLCDAVGALQHEKAALEQLARHVHAVTLTVPASAGPTSGGLAGRLAPSAGRAALGFTGGGSPEGGGGSRLRFTPLRAGQAGTPVPVPS